MAQFQRVTEEGETIDIVCRQDGRSNLFQHTPQYYTCNHCGNSFPTSTPGTIKVEQVVLVVDSDRR